MRRTRLKEWLARPQTIQINLVVTHLILTFVGFGLGYLFGALTALTQLR